MNKKEKMKIRTLLKKVRNLFGQGPDRWIKNRSAQDKDGRAVGTRVKTAYAFCLNGALHHFSLPPFSDLEADKIRILAYATLEENLPKSGWSLISWNDSSEADYEKVLNLLDKSIRRLNTELTPKKERKA